MYKIYLDDIRTPIDEDWIVVRNYDEFVNKTIELGLKNIDLISLDHDLGDTAISEYHNNVFINNQLDYSNIKEKTGLDCAKWLIDFFYETNSIWSSYDENNKKINKIKFPIVYTHSANPIGSENIINYINSFLKFEHQPMTCKKIKINFLIKK